MSSAWRKLFSHAGLARQVTTSLESAIQHAGLNSPTLIQTNTFPVLTKTKDAIITAETGSGKTLAYLVPLAAKLLSKQHAQQASIYTSTSLEIPSATLDTPVVEPTGIIVVPTYELSVQVGRVFDTMMEGANIKSAVLSKTNPFVIAPNTGAVVSTPGYLAKHDLFELFPTCEMLVVDEVDAILASSEYNLFKILSEYRTLRHMKPLRGGVTQRRRDTGAQMVFVGATVPAGGRETTAMRLRKHVPGIVEVSSGGENDLVRGVEHEMVQLSSSATDNKDSALLTVLHALPGTAVALVFCNTSKAVDHVAEMLTQHHWRVGVLHKRVPEQERAQTISRLGVSHPASTHGSDSEALQVVVATDIAARGLDIPTISHVVQYDFALDVSAFLHRVGRTARNGARGKAISLVDPAQAMLAKAIVDIQERKSDASDATLAALYSRNRSLRNKRRKQEREQS
eukprot:m.321873 g.321873  ORF g.321873 m.321873 type:complete len:455 (+) comp20338_c0_seq22:135-1499(+)